MQEQPRGRRDGRQHGAPDHRIEVKRLQQHLDRHAVGKVALGELHGTITIGRIVAFWNSTSGLQTEDGLESIKGILGLDLGGTIEERAQNCDTPRLFEGPAARSNGRNVVVAHFVGADLGGQAFQHRLAAQLRQHAVEGGGAGLDDAAPAISSARVLASCSTVQHSEYWATKSL